MATHQRLVIPDGWVVRGFRFEVEPTSPEQPARIRQHFGARRFAYNWALAQVKVNLAARQADPSVPLLPWNFYQLRRRWNQAKAEVAPWWPTCSKEAYASGIADLVQALHTWTDAKAGRRAGGRVGFPRFKSRRRDRGRVRFTTGAMRLEADRRHITLPVIGRLRSKETTRRLERLITKGRARVLSMTSASRTGGCTYRCRQSSPTLPVPPPNPTAAAGSTLASGVSGR